MSKKTGIILIISAAIAIAAGVYLLINREEPKKRTKSTLYAEAEEAEVVEEVETVEEVEQVTTD